MSLFLYNTMSGEKERFQPLVPGRVTMYVCGPTVYNLAHIGNARPVVVFDTLFRLLQTRFDEVVYARNRYFKLYSNLRIHGFRCRVSGFNSGCLRPDI